MLADSRGKGQKRDLRETSKYTRVALDHVHDAGTRPRGPTTISDLRLALALFGRFVTQATVGIEQIQTQQSVYYVKRVSQRENLEANRIQATGLATSSTASRDSVCLTDHFLRFGIELGSASLAQLPRVGEIRSMENKVLDPNCCHGYWTAEWPVSLGKASKQGRMGKGPG